MFVDRVRVDVRGGDGGAGVSSFHRARGKPRGKPDGGSGGAGGDVWLVADANLPSLLTYQHRPHRRAESGTHGEGDLRNGRRGDDLELPVPLGTVVRRLDGTIVADLVEDGQRYRAARGGRGGRGNAAFVGRRHRAPEFAEQGEYGERMELVLEVQLVADAALIGYPNAGKSTLISVLSAARPKIADYPFTTLEPNLGVVQTSEGEFVLADIPGLIEGAASGKGLGHEFLRHTERAGVLVFLLDPSPLQTDTPARQFEVLERELEEYSAELAERPRLVVLNKADLDEAESAAVPPGAVRISSVTGDGTEQLAGRIASLVADTTRAAPERQGYVLHQPIRQQLDVEWVGDRWLVTGRDAERAAGLDDLTRAEAADLVATRLKRAGVDAALRHAGAQPGDDVQIGDLLFEYEPDLLDEDEIIEE